VGKASAFVRAALAILLFAAAVGVVQWLTLGLRFPPFYRTTVWTPGALTCTALLLTPPRRWWVYYAGFCLGIYAAFYGDQATPAPRALLAAQFHFVATAAGAWALRRIGTAPPFGSVRWLVSFIAVVVVPVTVCTTGPIDVVRLLSGADDVWSVALRSLLAGFLGLLVATPALMLTVVNGPAWCRAAPWQRLTEIAGLATCLAAVGYLAFETPAGGETVAALLYAPLPLLLWAAMRFGLAGVCWALLGIAFQSTWGAIHGRGPFSSSNPPDNVLQLQLFLLTTALPLMFLALLVTERKRTETRFRLVVESAPNAIVIVNGEGHIVLVNVHCEKVFGYRREELVGQPVEVLVPERFRAEHPGYRAGFFAAPTARPMGAGRDLYGRRRDGSEFPVEIGLTPIQSGGGLLVLCAIVDITGRKRAEEARQELAHASRLALVGELTASIAHEINQPLGAILSNADAAELLLESSPAALDEVRQILGDIRKDDLRASEVIRRLRALLRKRDMEVHSLQLNEVVAEVLGLVRAESRRRGVAVETELAAELPPVRADRIHLQQVLLNLCFNGLEAMADTPGEKRLTVRTAVNAAGGVEGAVSDTGPGILPERLSRLFAPFFSTKKEGMGLGLSIARTLVEANGGRIRAENNPDGGATFRFTLPADGDRPNPEPPGKSNAPGGGRDDRTDPDHSCRGRRRFLADRRDAAAAGGRLRGPCLRLRGRLLAGRAREDAGMRCPGRRDAGPERAGTARSPRQVRRRTPGHFPDGARRHPDECPGHESGCRGLPHEAGAARGPVGRGTGRARARRRDPGGPREQEQPARALR
jgi:PAS domain S-box-containing protein